MKKIPGKQFEENSIAQSKLNFAVYTTGETYHTGETYNRTYIDNNLIAVVTGATDNLPKFDANGQLENSEIEAIGLDFDLIDFITLSNISANTDTVIPAGYRIMSLVCEETTGNAAGNISVGTITGGTNIVNSESLSANGLLDTALGTSIFSTTSSQQIFISSSSWGSAAVDFHIRLEKFIE
jgi:hypothetical protein